MKIDTEGTYTLRYTAEDECGNVTTEDRSVVVQNITYSTVLFTDGTFIINEKSTDRDANIALHGAVTNEYIPFNPNGSTDAEKYIFTAAYRRPWSSQESSVRRIEIGSPISPPNTAFWFSNFSNCNTTDFALMDTSSTTNMRAMFRRGAGDLDLSNFDTSAVTNMQSMFSSFNATSLDLSNFNTSAVTNMQSMFSHVLVPSLDLSNFDTSAVTTMQMMFSGCSSLTSLDVSSFDTSAVTDMLLMFGKSPALTSLDLSNFNTSAVTVMAQMFDSCTSLATVYASPSFVVDQVTSSNRMFYNTLNLVGGAGTTWNSANPYDKTYAHIDGGTADPGYFTARAA